jgi:hypothetical protein
LFEAEAGPLGCHEPWVAQPTSDLVPSHAPRYLACWRFEVDAAEEVPSDATLRRIRRSAAPDAPHVFVPAFSHRRPVVQHLGASLVAAQPHLDLERGLPGEPVAHAVPTFPRWPEPAAAWEERATDSLSPVLVGTSDAMLLAHFVYLAVQAQDAHESRSTVHYRLPLGEPQLLFLPALRDPRYIHEASWRLLLREFDGVVA